jgi:hypothetical protein
MLIENSALFMGQHAAIISLGFAKNTSYSGVVGVNGVIIPIEQGIDMKEMNHKKFIL